MAESCKSRARIKKVFVALVFMSFFIQMPVFYVVFLAIGLSGEFSFFRVAAAMVGGAVAISATRLYFKSKVRIKCPKCDQGSVTYVHIMFNDMKCSVCGQMLDPPVRL